MRRRDSSGAVAHPTRDPHPHRQETLDANPRKRRLARRKLSTSVKRSTGRRLVAAQIVLASMVAGSALAIGGVHPETVCVLVGFGLFAVGLGKLRWHPLAVLLFALGIVCLLQLLPLPTACVRIISPKAVEIWSRVAMSSGADTPAYVSTSVDPGATWVEAGKWFSYATAALLARGVSTEVSPLWLPRLVLGSAVVVAVVTAVHGLVGARLLYGFYDPTFAVARWSMGPLLNANNLAGYLNLAAFVGLGVLLKTDGTERWVVSVALGVIASVSLLTMSRGGLLSLLVGAFTCALLARRFWREIGSAAKVAAAASALLLAGVLAAVAAPTDFVGESISQNVDKLRLFQWSKPLISDFRATGVGRGAFAGVFPAYDEAVRNVTYAHAENFVMQWLAEWGLVTGGAGLVALVWLLRPAVFAFGTSVSGSCAFAGVLALGVQNLFDLGFEVPGVMVALIAVGSWSWGRGRGQAGKANVRYLRLTQSAMGIALLVSSAGIARFGTSTLQRDQRALSHAYQRLVGDRVTWDGFRLQAVAAMNRHPADPFLPRVAALAAQRERRDPMGWLSHSLERDPNDGRTHLLLARVLGERGALLQAMLEIRLSVDFDASLVGPASSAAVRITQQPAMLLRGAPSGSRGAEFLMLVAGQLRDPRSVEALFQRAAELGGRLHEATRRLVSFYIQHLTSRTEPCEAGNASRCEAAAQDAISSIGSTSGGGQASSGRLLSARLSLALNHPAEALQHISLEQCRGLRDSECYRVIYVAALRENKLVLSSTAADELLASVCLNRKQCALDAEILGGLAFNESRFVQAMAFYNRAAREEPNSRRFRKLGEAARKAGVRHLAIDALERADRLEGQKDPALRRLIEAERLRDFAHP